MEEIISTITLKLRSPKEAISLFGKNDENLKILRNRLKAKVIARGNELRLSGSDSEITEAKQTFNSLLKSIRRGDNISMTELQHSSNLKDFSKSSNSSSNILPNRVKPKTAGQRRYIEAISKSPITFGIGPAGTGKTYLAVATAISALKNKEVKRIILTRPAVEAGEKLGFLPGDLQAKIDPYLRPLYDSLYDMMDSSKIDFFLENAVIEVAPLAFMRGRTLNDAFIILDEAQNTTPEQMKMFLTRMGFHSKVVVTGDITQVDLPNNITSGLRTSERILKDIEGIEFLYFTESDVVRHPLVASIIKAYETIPK